MSVQDALEDASANGREVKILLKSGATISGRVRYVERGLRPERITQIVLYSRNGITSEDETWHVLVSEIAAIAIIEPPATYRDPYAAAAR